MVKHTQTICRQQSTNCLSVFDHFVKLVLKGLRVFLLAYQGFKTWNAILCLFEQLMVRYSQKKHREHLILEI